MFYLCKLMKYFLKSFDNNYHGFLYTQIYEFLPMAKLLFLALTLSSLSFEAIITSFIWWRITDYIS